MNAQHEKHMRRCLELAKNALKKGNPPVGSVLVRGEEIVGEGEEAGKSQQDISYHAEIEVIRDARKRLQTTDLSDCVLYTTHEPCWMCSYMIRHHQIPTIVISTWVNYVGGASSEFPILLTENVPQWKTKPKIIQGILEAECVALMQEYWDLIK